MMLIPPDAQRQYSANLAKVIKVGMELFETYDHLSLIILDGRHHPEAQQFEDYLSGWLFQTRIALTEDDSTAIDHILSQAYNPTWDEAWDSVTGRHEQRWYDLKGREISAGQQRIMRFFIRVLDYVKSLRIHVTPVSILSPDFYTHFAEAFHRMSLYTINDLFTKNGCLIDYWVPPCIEQPKQSSQHVFGWLDGLNLYIPDRLIDRVKAVYRSYREYKGFPIHLPPDHIQTMLNELTETSTKETSLARYHFHPHVEEQAAPYWRVQAYDAALLHVCIKLDVEVKARSGLSESGTSLMTKVFSKNSPILKIDPRFGNQQGFMNLFVGMIDAIRNPRAHTETPALNEAEAIEWLAFLSALFRVLDATSIAE